MAPKKDKQSGNPEEDQDEPGPVRTSEGATPSDPAALAGTNVGQEH